MDRNVSSTHKSNFTCKNSYKYFFYEFLYELLYTHLQQFMDDSESSTYKSILI